MSSPFEAEFSDGLDEIYAEFGEDIHFKPVNRPMYKVRAIVDSATAFVAQFGDDFLDTDQVIAVRDTDVLSTQREGVFILSNGENWAIEKRRPSDQMGETLFQVRQKLS